MPVTNAHLTEKLPWTERGMTGMPIKPTGRPSGTLANLAGIAENVGGLTAEERQRRDRPAPLLVMTEIAPHVTVNRKRHYRPASWPSLMVFSAVDRAIGLAVGAGRLIRRARPRRRR